MLLNNSVTVIASAFIFYFKAQELYNEKKYHHQLITEEQIIDKEKIIDESV